MKNYCYCWLLGVSLIAAGCSTPKMVTDSEGRVFRKIGPIDKVWSAEGFNVAAYDTLLVGEAKADSIVPKDEKETERLALMRAALPRDLATAIEVKKVFKSVTTSKADIKDGTKALRLEPRILEFTRGSSAARYTVGWGAGMPYVKVRGELSEEGASKPSLIFEVDEKGDWVFSGFTSSKTLQLNAASELADDVANLLANLARPEHAIAK